MMDSFLEKKYISMLNDAFNYEPFSAGGGIPCFSSYRPVWTPGTELNESYFRIVEQFPTVTHNFLLPSGITMGELALTTLRNEPSNITYTPYEESLFVHIQQHLHITLDEHLKSSLSEFIQTRSKRMDHYKSLMTCIKAWLTKHNLKSKGYQKNLKVMLEDFLSAQP